MKKATTAKALRNWTNYVRLAGALLCLSLINRSAEAEAGKAGGGTSEALPVPPLPPLPPGGSPAAPTAAPPTENPGAAGPAPATPPPEPAATSNGATPLVPLPPSNAPQPTAAPAGPGVEVPGLPALPPEGGLPGAGAAGISNSEKESMKRELLEMMSLADQLQKKIASLSQRLASVTGEGQLAPPPVLPEQPGGVTGPGLMPGATSPGASVAAPGAPAAAEPPKLANLKYPVSKFVLSYAPPEAKPNPKLPPIDKVAQTKVQLGPVDSGYGAPSKAKHAKNFNGPIASLTEEKIYNGEALQSVYTAVAAEMNKRGLYGILVLPDPADIDATTGEDLRAGRKELKVQIFTSTVRQVRTISKQAKPGQNAVDTPQYKWIALDSPLKTGSLLQKGPLQDYLTGLNRFPGRRVDAAVNASGDPGGIILDYIVRQEKPFYIYTQASNTGTANTGDWRLRLGLEYRNLIGHDDIFNADYITSTDGQSVSILGSYQRAILEPDKLKLRIYGSWGKFTASDVGFDLQNFEGQSWTAGLALTASPFKFKGVPVDLFIGAEWKNVSVVNHTFPSSADSNFFVPYIGFSFQQATDRYTYAGSAQIEHNFPDIAGTRQADIDQLGRFNTNREFTVAKGSFGTTFFLEPLIFGAKWKEGSTWWKSTLAHEMAFSAHGQYALNKARLIPQFEDVIGGFTSVRGYPESLTAGDTTAVGSAEYRLHLPRLLKPASQVASDKAVKSGAATAADVPPPKFSLRPPNLGSSGAGRPDWDLILRGFVDAGMTFNDRRIPSAEANETIASTGVGLELQVTRYVDIRVDWGVALIPEKDFLVNPVHRGDSRFSFLFSLLW